MTNRNLKQQYHELHTDNFPRTMHISFGEDSYLQTLQFEKVTWSIGGEEKGLRYGENPHQSAALYRLLNGNLVLGDVKSVSADSALVSAAQLRKSGKHPGMINITDVDSALSILRYFPERPTAVIIKHNNPCGVAQRDNLAESYVRAFMADPIAAFGGVVALNREVDAATAEEINRHYTEVIVAPSYTDGAMQLFEKKKNLRIMEIKNIERLQQLTAAPHIDFHSLIDGGLVLQWSYTTRIMTTADFLPAETEYKGKHYRVNRAPTEAELQDLLFGWQVESGVTSNSVLFVKDRTTVGIGTGEQDRVGCAQIARDKAYAKALQRFSLNRYGKNYQELAQTKQAQIDSEVHERHADIQGGVMVSDGFFPFRDGVEVGLHEGVSAVVQPGGSIRDFETIEACNDFGAAMLFTGERSFRH
ncbi:MAG: IMP cyclohydrolase [Spirochaetaceae bacterium]|nr:IMP cyclohydrolase [Spirochaetaceae bacterium]MCF7948181.1 IMP cyclohydrolase [Spirochaetia bacterium]MCF7950797.1 IMP cyclohydrolase [Spirochaetaceae bacterium]